MNLYAILRRNGWTSADELQTAAARSIQVLDTVILRPDPADPAATT
jgi:hypothetical protein